MPEYLAPGVFVEETSHSAGTKSQDVGGFDFRQMAYADDPSLVQDWLMAEPEKTADSGDAIGGFSDVSGLGREINLSLPEVDDEVIVGYF